ncbi:MAG TPA: glycosyltransferase 87 family protein [Chthoniobacterales bacterium]|jgi:hypothetical protein|nr:glycosyltransferase 87 family protein [Chthoniobacterales bacterium]
MSEESISADQTIEPLRSRHFLAALIGLGVVGFVIELFFCASHSENRLYWEIFWLLVWGVPFVFAVHWTFRQKKFPANTLLIILVGGALFRLILVPLDPPRLSTDIYRYIWDGRVQGAGINPYLYLPADPRLAKLRDETIYPNINRKEYAHTIYPPLAQLFFFALTRITQSVTGFKAGLVMIDLVTLGLAAATLRAMGQPAERVIVYAWHPLPIVEFGASGHIDALMICFIAVALLARARQKFGLAGLALGAATLVKLIPVVLLPAICKRRDRKLPIVFAITVVIGYLPYLFGAGVGVLGFLPQYTREEGLQNGAGYYLLDLIDDILDWCGVVHSMPPAVFTGIALGFLGAIALWAFYRPAPIGIKDSESHSRWLFFAFLLALSFSVLLSSYYPWYYTWLALFLCFVPNSATLLLTLILWPLYRSLFEQTEDDLFRFQSRVFLPFFGLLILFWWLRKWPWKMAAKR